MRAAVCLAGKSIRSVVGPLTELGRSTGAPERVDCTRNAWGVCQGDPRPPRCLRRPCRSPAVATTQAAAVLLAVLFLRCRCRKSVRRQSRCCACLARRQSMCRTARCARVGAAAATRTVRRRRRPSGSPVWVRWCASGPCAGLADHVGARLHRRFVWEHSTSRRRGVPVSMLVQEHLWGRRSRHLPPAPMSLPCCLLPAAPVPVRPAGHSGQLHLAVRPAAGVLLAHQDSDGALAGAAGPNKPVLTRHGCRSRPSLPEGLPAGGGLCVLHCLYQAGRVQHSQTGAHSQTGLCVH